MTPNFEDEGGTYCALCGEEFEEGEEPVDCIDGGENHFLAHRECLES